MRRLRPYGVAGGLLLSALSLSARAGTLTGGATEWTQLANNYQLIASYGQQAQQTATQLKQYEAELQNLKNLVPVTQINQAAQQLWNQQNMFAVFRNLHNLIINGQRASYSLSNLDSQYRQLYPGYTPNMNYQQAYANWSNNTNNAIENSMAAVGADSQMLDSEQAMTQGLLQDSQSAQGQMQAIQAGNQISLSMVGQMQKLRQLQQAQMQTQNAYIAGQQADQDANRTAAKAVTDAVPDATYCRVVKCQGNAP